MKSHGHFLTFSDAKKAQKAMTENEKRRVKNPRIKIITIYRIKKLANGKYSIQSTTIYKKGYTKKRITYKNRFNLKPNSVAYKNAVKKEALVKELGKLQKKIFRKAPSKKSYENKSIQQLQEDIKHLQNW